MFVKRARPPFFPSCCGRLTFLLKFGNCLVQILEVVKRRPIRAIVLTSRGVGIPLQSPNPRFSLFSLYQPLKAPEVRQVYSNAKSHTPQNPSGAKGSNLR